MMSVKSWNYASKVLAVVLMITSFTLLDWAKDIRNLC